LSGAAQRPIHSDAMLCRALHVCLFRRLDAAHALIDAYKHHLSDEVASHHQREETWMAVQTEWEKLEQELNAEIES
jgi:hypothetical protein